jgi:hypothetical protein
MELPNSLIEAIEQRRLVPFIGAGFSKNIHNDIPSWSEVIYQSSDLLGYDPEILKIQGDYLQIAEYLDIKDKLGKLYNKLSKQIENSSYSVKNSLPHQLLPYIDVQSIYTTNWDSWIEAGFVDQKIPYSKIVKTEDFVNPSEVYVPPIRLDSDLLVYPTGELPNIKTKHRDTTIVKFHGDFNNTASIVFKESHYFDRLDFEQPLDIRLRSEMIGKAMLFIGYSFSDLNVRYIWHKLNKMMKNIQNDQIVKSYFVTHFNNPLLIEVFKRNNIETILLNPRDLTEDIKILFEKIIKIQMK